MDFPKKQAQRLMPLYLLEYNEKLFEKHPDPEAPWGGGGSDYTAGYGIDITWDNKIQVDMDVIATKSDISGMVTTNTNQTINAIKRFNNQVYIMDNDNIAIVLDPAGIWIDQRDAAINQGTSMSIQVDRDSGDPLFTWGKANTANYNTYKLPHTDLTGNHHYILATTDDIPSLTGYATESWVQNQGYLTSAALTNYVTTTQLEDALDDYALKTDIPENVSDLNNDAGYTTQTWVENQGYSKFSGSYNDLTDKPTIPTVNDPTITFTQGGVTKGSITLNQSSNQTIALDAGSSSVDWTDITNKPDLLPIVDMSEAFTFTETGNHYPPYKWGENMACTSTWVCYGSVEVLPQIYLSNWFSTPYEFIAYPQYIWQDQDGYHAVYSAEFTENDFVASGARIVLNAPSLGATWTSVSIYPVYGFDQVNNATITLTQGGVNKGSFTVNQWQDQTIALDAAGSSYSAGTGIDITNNEISIDNTVALKSEVPSTATSTSTSTVTPTTGTFVTGTSTNTANVVNSVTYTPSSETLTFTYSDNTTASFTFLTSSTTVTSGTTSVVTSVTDSTSSAMTGATVSTTTTTTLS